MKARHVSGLVVGFLLGVALVSACSSGSNVIAQGMINAIDVLFDNNASGLAAANVQDAIDENAGNAGDPSGLNTTDQSSLVNAINELAGNIGMLANLNTADKSSLVAAINEVLAGAQGGGGAGAIMKTGGPFMGSNSDLFSIGIDGAGTGEPRQTIIAPRNGMLASLFLTPDAAPAAGAVVNAVVRINGVDTALGVTHTAAVDGANAVGNIATMVPIAQGDRLTVHFTSGVTAAGQNFNATFEYR